MSATPPNVSPAGSVSGYSLRVWLARNKGYLKGLVSIAFGLVTPVLNLVLLWPYRDLLKSLLERTR